MLFSQLSLCLWLMLLKAVPCWVVIGPIDPIRILIDFTGSIGPLIRTQKRRLNLLSKRLCRNTDVQFGGVEVVLSAVHSALRMRVDQLIQPEAAKDKKKTRSPRPLD